MKRARDIRDQLVGLMERVEIDMQSANGDLILIKKVSLSNLPKYIYIPKIRILIYIIGTLIVLEYVILY